MSLRLVDRYHQQLQHEQQMLIDAGHLQKKEELALLESEQLRPLALLSLYMLIGGGLFFVGLDMVTYFWQRQHWMAPLSLSGVVLWFLINLFAYVCILCLHEAIHGLFFAFWGGQPHFGAKLPLALYCGARQQLFRRNHYLSVGLAPVIVLTLVGIACTLLAPGLSSYLLLAFVGNVSGAAGDVIVAQRIMRFSSQTLVEDTEVGYTAWELLPDVVQASASAQ